MPPHKLAHDPWPVTQRPTRLRWLYIDFNSYFASVEQQLRPELRGKPIAIVPVETDATCAIAASYEAKAYGIKTNTPIHEARRLCPQLICVRAHHEHYVSMHHRIVAEVNRHLPVSAVCSIDEVACILMENEATPETAIHIAHRIKQGLVRTVGEYIRCSIGIAPNKYLAKVATDLQKPDGLTVLESDAIAARLYSLPLRDLPGIGYSMEHRIRMHGIGSVEMLYTLSPQRMYRIWGNRWGEKMYYLLRGYDLPDEETSRSTIGHSHVMAPELRDPARAIHVARRLTLKAASRLRRLGYYASALTFSARIEHGPRVENTRNCTPAMDSLTFLHMLQELWHSTLPRMPYLRLKKVSVVLHQLTAMREYAPDMLAETSLNEARQKQKHERLSLALDRINHRFGRDSIAIGMRPDDGRSFSDTKVAFTRIPDMEEFLE